MSEIKLVSIKTAQERFKDYMKEKGISLSSSLVHINKISQFEEQERKELRAAYEAKCNEVAQLQKENVELKHINLTSLANLHFKNRELEARNSELEAVRLAYANEFPLNSEGEPDVGSIHQNIRKLKAECAKFLSEQDYQYNKQTNKLIARHATQIKILEQQNLALIEQLVKVDMITPRTYVIDASDGVYRFNGFEFTQEAI